MLHGNEHLAAEELDASIERGLDFLQRSQLPTGEFKSTGPPTMRSEKSASLTVPYSDCPDCLLARVLQFDKGASDADQGYAILYCGNGGTRSLALLDR